MKKPTHGDVSNFYRPSAASFHYQNLTLDNSNLPMAVKEGQRLDYVLGSHNGPQNDKFNIESRISTRNVKKARSV